MKYLKIENDGCLDVRLISLMGGTTKASDKYKIGQFGTGLKYVLAHLFRNDVDFKIVVNGEAQVIETKRVEIGADAFDVIHINGTGTSITTKMGLEWEPWMIVREIYSNALDEGGSDYSIVDEIAGAPGKTEFYIEFKPEFQKIYNDWNRYFKVKDIPMFENEEFAVYPSGGEFRLYKQGILIHKEEKKRGVFSYDIKNASINEMREYKGLVNSDLYRCIANFPEPVIEYFLENCTDQMFEYDIDYKWYRDYLGKFSQTWQTAIGSAKIIHKKAKDILSDRGHEIDDSYIEVSTELYGALSSEFEGIGALKSAKQVGDYHEIHSEDLVLKLKSALSILETARYFVDPELEYRFVVFGDVNVAARILTDKKLILISEKMADKSMFDFCAMLIEENEHYRTGADDYTRKFQQHFIDLYTSILLKSNGIQL